MEPEMVPLGWTLIKVEVVETTSNGTTAMTELYGRVGSRVDKIGFKCRNVHNQRVHDGGSVGENGGSEATQACGQNQFVNTINGRAGRLLDNVSVGCATHVVSTSDTKPESAEDTEQDQKGGSGGSPFRKSCPSGTVMTTVKVRAGKAIDQINGIGCMPTESVAKGITTGYQWKSMSKGGSGGTLQTLKCDPTSAMVQLQTRTDSLVDQMKFRCKNIHTGVVKGTGTEKAGGTGGTEQKAIDCADAFIVGLHGKAGKKSC
jgi:hypothetical protein